MEQLLQIIEQAGNPCRILQQVPFRIKENLVKIIVIFHRAGKGAIQLPAHEGGDRLFFRLSSPIAKQFQGSQTDQGILSLQKGEEGFQVLRLENSL